MTGYLVFAREQHAEPLALGGTIQADGDGGAAAEAVRRFGDAWIELALVPEPAIHWVIEARASTEDGT